MFTLYPKRLIYISYLLIAFTSALFANSLNDEEEKIQKVLGQCEYILCFDGGGSKTALQILNSKGEVLDLYHHQEQTQTIHGECSNIVVVGAEEIKNVLYGMLQDLSVGKRKAPLESILSKCGVVGGFAGLGREESKKQMQDIFESFGFEKDKLALFSDAALSLHLVGESGAILIGGTGSICFIKEEGALSRIGGLGYRIGDLGSGYWIGLEAIKAALEEEYGYGLTTSLTDKIKEHFQVENCKDLIAPINGNLSPPYQIASLAPLVFEEAYQEDPVALRVFEKAAHELGDLLAQGIEKTDLKHCLTYLIGGLFQSPHANQFIKYMLKSPKMQALSKRKRPLLVNLSDKMFPALVVQEYIKKNQHAIYKQISSLPLVEVVQYDQPCLTCNPEFNENELDKSIHSFLSRKFYRNCHEGLKSIYEGEKKDLDFLKPFIQQNYAEVSQKILEKLLRGGDVYLFHTKSQTKFAHDLSQKWKEYLDESKVSSLCSNIIPIYLSSDHSKMQKKNDQEEGCTVDKRDLEIKENDVCLFLSGLHQKSIELKILPHLSESNLSYAFIRSDERNEGPFLNGLVKALIIQNEEKMTHFCHHEIFNPILEFACSSLLNEVLYTLEESQEKTHKGRGIIQWNYLREAYQQLEEKLSLITQAVQQEMELVEQSDCSLWKRNPHVMCASLTLLSDHLEFDKPLEAGDDFFSKLMDGRVEIDPCKKEISTDDTPNLDPQNQKRHRYVFAQIDPLLKEDAKTKIFQDLLALKQKGARICLVNLHLQSQKEEQGQLIKKINPDLLITFTDIAKDPLGLIHSLLQKQVLNLFCQASSNCLNKCYGNMSVDLEPYDPDMALRTLNILKLSYRDVTGKKYPYPNEILSDFVRRALKYKSLAEQQLGKHVPCASKIVFTMLEKKCDVETAVSHLKYSNENLKLLVTPL